MQVIFNVPARLANELQHAAKISGLSPSSWAAQMLEAVLATRRLPRVPVAHSGARIGVANVEEEPDGFPVNCEIPEIP